MLHTPYLGLSTFPTYPQTEHVLPRTHEPVAVNPGSSIPLMNPRPPKFPTCYSLVQFTLNNCLQEVMLLLLLLHLPRACLSSSSVFFLDCVFPLFQCFSLRKKLPSPLLGEELLEEEKEELLLLLLLLLLSLFELLLLCFVLSACCLYITDADSSQSVPEPSSRAFLACLCLPASAAAASPSASRSYYPPSDSSSKPFVLSSSLWPLADQ